MSNYLEIDGNLITLAQRGNFDVIAHGCNCFCQMGAGIAPQMANAFMCNDSSKYPSECPSRAGDMSKLGNIESYAWYVFDDEGNRCRLEVVNAYTQYKYGRNHADGEEAPFNYSAFELCMKKINHRFKGKRIGLPMIGAGLAGGDWEKIKQIITKELKECIVTIVIYKK